MDILRGPEVLRQAVPQSRAIKLEKIPHRVFVFLLWEKIKGRLWEDQCVWRVHKVKAILKNKKGQRDRC